jgi:hypothetical protein
VVSGWKNVMQAHMVLKHRHACKQTRKWATALPRTGEVTKVRISFVEVLTASALAGG